MFGRVEKDGDDGSLGWNAYERMMAGLRMIYTATKSVPTLLIAEI
jgi:hypothetical protein